MYNNFILYSGKIVIDLMWDVLYFPAWWYSRGLLNLLLGLKNFLRDKEKALALVVWVKNIFRPMYAQYDWQGMLISFFMRLVQIIFRSLVMLFWLIVSLAAVIFWILLPLLVIYEIIFQFI